MASSVSESPRQLIVVSLLSAIILAMLGLIVAPFVSRWAKNDGLSDFERLQQAQMSVTDTLKAQGVKMQTRHYPLGDALVVNMSGLTITDDMLRQLKQAGNVAELDLSRSTITDDQMGVMMEVGLQVFLFKFDLSQTAVTDAGFEKLDNLRFLSYLNLTGTKVTPAAVERFKHKRQTDTRVIPQLRNPTIKLN